MTPVQVAAEIKWLDKEIGVLSTQPAEPEGQRQNLLPRSPLILDDAASHSRYAGTMSDSPGLIALRKSLGDSSPELPPETPKQMAHDAIRQILDAIESGVCPLGDWERRCLGAAITSLRGGHTHEARSRARQALWSEENRRNAAIAKFLLRPGMASVAELKREFEAARAMPGRAGRRGAETV
jgi:hypothetical protein